MNFHVTVSRVVPDILCTYRYEQEFIQDTKVVTRIVIHLLFHLVIELSKLLKVKIGRSFSSLLYPCTVREVLLRLNRRAKCGELLGFYHYEGTFIITVLLGEFPSFNCTNCMRNMGSIHRLYKTRILRSEF